jgi:hypothetical protein
LFFDILVAAGALFGLIGTVEAERSGLLVQYAERQVGRDGEASEGGVKAYFGVLLDDFCVVDWLCFGKQFFSEPLPGPVVCHSLVLIL